MKTTRRIGNPYAHVRKGPQSLVNLYRFDILFYVSIYISTSFSCFGFPVFPQNRQEGGGCVLLE